MGDEAGLSHQGNNNPWCQDNPTSWLDWDLLERNRDLLRFVRRLVRLSQGLALLGEDRFWTATSAKAPGEISWHGLQPGRPDWTPSSRSLAFTLDHPAGERVMVLLNAWDRPLEFTLPAPGQDRRWLEVVNTAHEPPQDIVAPAEAAPVPDGPFVLADHSVAVLLAGSPATRSNPEA